MLIGLLKSNARTIAAIAARNKMIAMEIHNQQHGRRSKPLESG